MGFHCMRIFISGSDVLVGLYCYRILNNFNRVNFYCLFLFDHACCFQGFSYNGGFEVLYSSAWLGFGSVHNCRSVWEFNPFLLDLISFSPFIPIFTFAWLGLLNFLVCLITELSLHERSFDINPFDFFFPAFWVVDRLTIFALKGLIYSFNLFLDFYWIYNLYCNWKLAHFLMKIKRMF